MPDDKVESFFRPTLDTILVVGCKSQMTAKYWIRLMFEWGGGCLWCRNDAARDQFGVGPIEDLLPLSGSTRGRLTRLSEWHDRALDWDYPPDPSPWTSEEFQGFEGAAQEILQVIREELGSEFEVVYEQLGGPQLPRD